MLQCVPINIELSDDLNFIVVFDINIVIKYSNTY